MTSAILFAALALLDGANASKTIRLEAERANAYGVGYVREGTDLVCSLKGEAGWRPVNRLFPVDPKTGVLAEQFGARYVTLFNPSRTEPKTVTVPAVRELVTGGKVSGKIELPPETCRVLDFEQILL